MRTGAILAAALLVRVVWAAFVPMQPISDSEMYGLFASNLAHGHGYCYEPGTPTAFWPVGTSFLYSLTYRLLGEGTLGPVILNTLAGCVTVWLTIVVVRQWFGEQVAVLAGWLVAVWPVQVEFTTVLASENFFTPLVLGGVLLWNRAHAARVHAFLLAAAGGVVFAGASLIRPTALLVPIMLAGLVWAQGTTRTRTFWLALGMGSVMAATLSPWVIRNTLVFERPVIISTNGGTNLWMGNNPETTGFYQSPPILVQGELENDKALGRLAREYIADHPIQFLGRSIYKAIRLHERQTIGIAWNPGLAEVLPASGVALLKWGGQLFWLLTLGAAVAGVLVSMVKRGIGAAATAQPLFLWAFFTGVFAVVVIQDRYVIPVIPIIAGYGAYAVLAFAAWLRGRTPIA